MFFDIGVWCSWADDLAPARRSGFANGIDDRACVIED
jgi:hypothetical protein